MKQRACSLLVVLLIALLAACTPQTPIRVIVTPTPAPVSVTPTPIPSATLTPLPSATPIPAATAIVQVPTLTSTPIQPTTAPTLTPTFTATPSAIPTRDPNLPTLPTYGAVIPPGYVSPTASGTPTPLPPGLLTTVPTTPRPGVPTTIPGTIFVPSPVPTTPGPSPTPLPVLRADAMGIQIHGILTDDDWQTMLNHAKTLGVRWIKVQLQWKEMQPTRDTYNDNYGAMQLRVQRAHVQGFKTLLSVAKAPDWARAPGTLASANGEDGPPADPKDLAAFLTRVVRDYKPEFIDAIEIWNEPNLSREWHGSPLTGASYLPYFEAGYRAIRLQEQTSAPGPDPAHRITIISAAPAAAAPNTATSTNDRDWLSGLYTAGLARYGADIAIGAHPYGWANPPDATCCTASPGVTGWYENRGFYFKDTLDDYHAIMTRAGHKAAKIWVTEFGWATYDGLHRTDGGSAGAPSDAGFGWLRLLNQRQQTDYTIRAFTLVQRPPYSDFVGPLMLWNLNFGTIPGMIDGGREEAGFSLLDRNGSGRLIYQAIAASPKQ